MKTLKDISLLEKKAKEYKLGNAHLAKYNGRRKHIKQMSKKESDGLYKRLKEIGSDEWKLTGHAMDRIKEKKIKATMKDIVSTLSYGNIVEYKIDYNPYHKTYEERVVFRGKARVNKCNNLNVVYNLTTKKINTVWLNDIDDSHHTLNWNLYSADLEVSGI